MNLVHEPDLNWTESKNTTFENFSNFYNFINKIMKISIILEILLINPIFML